MDINGYNLQFKIINYNHTLITGKEYDVFLEDLKTLVSMNFYKILQITLTSGISTRRMGLRNWGLTLLNETILRTPQALILPTSSVVVHVRTIFLCYV